MDDQASAAAILPPARGAGRLHVLEQQLNPQQPAAAARHPPALHTHHTTAVQQTEAGRQSSSGQGVQQGKFLERFAPPCQDVSTLHDNWESAITRFPDIPALGWRSVDACGNLGPYNWLTYLEVGAVRTAIGAGLLQLGILPGSAVGLYSINCKEWVLLDAAAHAFSMITVPLYDSLGPDAVQYIINHAELVVVGCSTTVLPKVLACLPECPTVKLLVVWDTKSQLQPLSQAGAVRRGDTKSGTATSASSNSWRGPAGSDNKPLVPETVTCCVRTMDQLEALGRAFTRPHIAPGPTDVATICYTSGTTGMPKGAVLTHASLIANAAGCAAAMHPLAWAPGARHLSFLPLAHIFERKNLTVSVHFGCSIGFYGGDARTVFQDAAVLQPDMFLAVPRVYNRLHDAVMAQVRGMNAVQRRMFDMAYAYKAAAIEAGDISGGLLAPLLDRLLFNRVKQWLGGRVRYMSTGSSPISPKVLTFLRVCFGADVFEGYGMTETACTISIARQGDTTVGHVGQPLACCEVKLVDIADMGYCTTDTPHARGEVCVRGPILFRGYHKEPQQTAAVVDSDGWFHTGDVGQWLPCGRLQLIDRKKHLFKLAQGEYVSPEKLESIYIRSPFVLQAFVHGDSTKHQLVAIAVPNPEILLPWALGLNLPQHLPALCTHPVAKQVVLSSMVQQAREALLQGYEVVAAVWLVPQPFTVEAGLLTPTMKFKRHAARQRFRTAIDSMYTQLAVASSSGTNCKQ